MKTENTVTEFYQEQLKKQEQHIPHRDELIENINHLVFLQLSNHIESIKVKLLSVEYKSATVKIVEDVQIGDLLLEKGEQIEVSLEQLKITKPHRIKLKQPPDKTGKMLNDSYTRYEKWKVS